MSRAAARLVILFLCLLLAVPASALPGDSAGVRQGTTELEAPGIVAPVPDDSADAASTVQTLPSSVADAPRTASGALHMPPVPAGFNSYDGGWIRFIYHPSSRERVQPLIAQADAVRHELIQRLGFPALSSVRVEIARTPGEMETFAPAGAPYPKYAAGVTYSELGLILLTLTPVHPGTEQDLGEVFRHELAHVALGDAISGREIPRWFNEGFAVLASGESSFGRMMPLAMSSIGGSLIPLRDLERVFPDDETRANLAYAEAVDVVRFLVRREDAHRFHALIQHLREGESFDRAVFVSYGIELNRLELEWRDDVAHRYTFWPILLSGTGFWVVALGVFVWGWRRRKRRDKLTLQQWARDEAAEDIIRARLAARQEAARVHIVLARGPEPQAAQVPPPKLEVEVPRVEHDGQWHTLH
ncbi:MAG TPA: peptidase MA family metallohydrolase [Polyangiaceae bacterium]